MALWLLCAAYLLPGLIGRDPWRNADVTAFGQMLAIAEGRTPWWAPTLGGVPADTALLPHWLGAAFIGLTTDWLDPAFAARLPFALMLAGTLVMVWYTTFHLARTDAAQPVAFAFGGEAQPVDYARAIADGAVLALLATLGLLVLGHETTPELMQLFAISLFSYALAVAPYRTAVSRAALMAALTLLAGSGAPSVAMAVGVGGLLVCSLSRYAKVRAQVIWVAIGMALAAMLAGVMGAWRWRAEVMPAGEWSDIGRQWLWFMWPAWPLALLTLWRWRRQLSHRHLSVPLISVIVALGANLSMVGSDRALMLGLPGLAVLAAFALPTLKRSAAAAIDWFSICFFTLFAAWVWFVYASMHTGWPRWQAANVFKILPGYAPQFSLVGLVVALAGTACWVYVVRWRTGRHREALWKSLVLPAGGVALCWMLALTLWLQPLDYARSPRPLVNRIATLIPPNACVAAPGLAPSAVAAMEFMGRWKVDARQQPPAAECNYLLTATRSTGPIAPPEGWIELGRVQRPTDREEVTQIFKRQALAP